MAGPRLRVALLGASRYNVTAIRALAATGDFFVIVADGNAEAPALHDGDAHVVVDIRDGALLRDSLAPLAPDGIVSLNEAGVIAAALASTALGLPTIGEEVARRVTSKVAMRRAWDAIPESSVAWRAVTTLEEARSAAAELGGFPLMLKPDRTNGGSRGVSRVDDTAALADAFAFAQTNGFTRDVIVEELVTGSEHSAEVLVDGERVSVLCVGEKVKTAAPYRVDMSVQYPAALDAAQESRVATMCANAVRALGITRGVAHVEFAYTARGPVLFELGARCGGGHTPVIASHVSGVDELAEVCRMACGVPPRAFAAETRRGADYRFLAFPPGVFEEGVVPESLRADRAIADAGFTVARGGALREVRTGSDRAGFVVALGASRAEAVAAADRAVAQFAVRYADGSQHRALTLAELSST